MRFLNQPALHHIFKYRKETMLTKAYNGVEDFGPWLTWPSPEEVTIFRSSVNGIILAWNTLLMWPE